MSESTPTAAGSLPPSRRKVLSVGATVALGAGAVAGCSADEATSAAQSAAGEVSAAASEAGAAASAAAGAAKDAVAVLGDIPVGGAVVKEIAGKQVVLVQPEAGSVKAFDAACPHQGCAVAPKDGTLVCPCHGSVFELATGAVTKGPATKDLAGLDVTVTGDGVSLG